MTNICMYDKMLVLCGLGVSRVFYYVCILSASTLEYLMYPVELSLCRSHPDKGPSSGGGILRGEPKQADVKSFSSHVSIGMTTYLL